MKRFVVDYQVWAGKELLRPGQCDITTDHIWLDDPAAAEGNRELAALVTRTVTTTPWTQV